jgi:hypothetical protein
MGAWGMEPKDNDGSCDLYYRVEKARDNGGLSSATNILHETLKKGTPEYTSETNFKWELLGMLQLFLEDLDNIYGGSIDHEEFWKTAIVPEILWLSHQFTQDVFNDQDWIDGWEEQDDVRKHLKSFQKLLLTLIPKCCA